MSTFNPSPIWLNLLSVPIRAENCNDFENNQFRKQSNVTISKFDRKSEVWYSIICCWLIYVFFWKLIEEHGLWKIVSFQLINIFFACFLFVLLIFVCLCNSLVNMIFPLFLTKISNLIHSTLLFSLFVFANIVIYSKLSEMGNINHILW